MKMLEKVRQATRKVPLNDVPKQTSLPQSNTTEATISDDPQHSNAMPPRKLQRVTTIQDSQTEDLDLSNATLVAESPVKLTQKLKRVATVQDSQYDQDEILSDDGEAAEDISNDTDPPEEQLFGVGDTQATFDPVHSALDRDAARFKWTQTQGFALPIIDEHGEDSETDDEDLDRGCGRSSQVQEVEILHARPEVREEPVFDHHQAPSKQSQPDLGLKAVSSDVNSDESGDITLRPDDALPSSPPVESLSIPDKSSHDSAQATGQSHLPPTHPSQIGTVVPTQASLQHLSSDDNDRSSDLPQYGELSEASTILPFNSSPQLQNHRSNAASLGSQMPLPPWSSPFQPPNPRGANHDELEMEDWSLPPPPPMSSSRVGTPAGSSK
jgi:hypothetical protein